MKISANKPSLRKESVRALFSNEIAGMNVIRRKIFGKYTLQFLGQIVMQAGHTVANESSPRSNIYKPLFVISLHEKRRVSYA